MSGASSRAFQRARAMTAAFSSASMVAMRISIERTQSNASIWPRTSCSICDRSGQAAMVSAMSTTTSSPVTAMARTMPRSTMVSPNSGSMTARRHSRTASSRLSTAGAGGGEGGEGGSNPGVIPVLYLRGGEFRPPGPGVVNPSRTPVTW